MTAGKPEGAVALAFEMTTMRLALSDILPLRDITEAKRRSIKYIQIAASIEEVGIIEPPVVIRDQRDPERYHLLDGHLRLDILTTRRTAEVVCLVATEDEAYTYNRRLSRLATIQEHRMILNAIKKGASEERLARALNVDIDMIRRKRNLLVGICPEVAELLRDKHLPLNAFIELRRLKPLRQIAAAEIMIAMNRYSLSYVRSIVTATPDDQLVESRKKPGHGLTMDQIALMERESEGLDREIRLIEKNYGVDHLDLVLAIGYVTRLLGNAQIVRHLAQYHAELLHEFQKIIEVQQAA